jgi:hypothetical protein
MIEIFANMFYVAMAFFVVLVVALWIASFDRGE